MKSHILFISSFFPDELEEEFLKQSKVATLDYASHNLQRAIIRGFDENMAEYSVINVPHLGSFPPYYKTPFVKGYKSNDKKIDSVAYLNILYLKRSDTKRRVRKRILSWMSHNSGHKTILFYSYDFVSLGEEIKQVDPAVTTLVLAADLPEFLSTDNSLITRASNLLSKIRKEKSFAQFIDGYVLLAPAMKDRLPVGERPWMQLEGIYNPERDSVNPEKANGKVVLYTGHLARRYGIEDLLKAFHMIDRPDYKLWICGVGDGISIIKEYEAIDERIKYLGTFTREKIISLQKQATLLINPRHKSDDYTKYSFPSKTMEYMASGTPTLMSHLLSIPKEYDEFLHYFEGETSSAIAKKIQEICEMDSSKLNEFGARARHFILTEKVPKPQVCKLLQFIYSFDR
jgi:glycosyltransferase involved in cell wall biosynthesis